MCLLSVYVMCARFILVHFKGIINSTRCSSEVQSGDFSLPIARANTNNRNDGGDE